MMFLLGVIAAVVVLVAWFVWVMIRENPFV